MEVGGINMDITTLEQMIAQFGFPIVVCIALGYFVWQLYKQSVKREEKLMAVNEKAIATISKYADKLDAIQEDVKEIKSDITSMMANN
jgi:chromosome segregation ATPase